MLIVGASGGCGTAFLQLGALVNFEMYGLASSGKHALLREYGMITGLLFIGTIATGGLLSTGQAMPAVVLRLHQITPFSLFPAVRC